MPNLLASEPVVILAWPPAPMSGLMRKTASWPAALGGSDSRQRVQLTFGLDVDLVEADVDGMGKFLVGLADTGEDDGISRNTGGHRLADLALRDRVGTCAEPRQCLEDGEVAVGLHREENAGLRRADGLCEKVVVPLERGGGITVEGRADRIREGGDVDVLGVEPTVAVGEVMHGAAQVRFGG